MDRKNGDVQMSTKTSEKYHYNLNLRLLLNEAPSPEEAKKLRQIISKALYAEGYNFLIWEQPAKKV